MHNRNPYPIHRSRAPLGLLAAVALAALLLSGGVLAWLTWQFAQLPPLVAGLLRVALLTSPLVAGAVGLAIAWRRWASIELLKADRVVALTAAQNQRFPAALTSLSFHDSSKPQAAPELPALPEPAPEAETPIPTFGQLLDAGKIGPGRPLILGIDAESHEAIAGSWKDLYSCGIGGLQGGGKSWLAAFLLAQSAAQGGRLIICDPHAGDEESLATRIAALSPAFMCDVASTPDQILAALKLANDKLERRKADSSLAQWPIIVVVDEWTSLLRGKLGDVLPLYAENFAEQGRKYNVNALLSAQGWTKDVTGAVRNRLTSHYVLRQRPDEARYQLGLQAGQCPLDVRLLPDATAYLLTVRGELKKIIVPRMTEADLEKIGALIAAPAAAVGSPFGFHRVTAPVTPSASLATSRKHNGDTMVTSAVPVTTASGSGKIVSPEAARALALLHDGKSIPAIVKELRGAVPRDGRRYMTALDDVTDLLRQATKGD